MLACILRGLYLFSMGFRFRKSFSVIPGVRINLGKKGTSLSVGGKGITTNFSDKGVRNTFSIPGTGLSYSNYEKTKPASAGVGKLLFGVVILVVAIVIFARVFS